MRGIVFGEENKILTNSKPIEILDKVRIVSIPLSDSTGLTSVCCVKQGQKVLIGQLIGKANGDFSVNVHSSVSGTVHAIEEKMTCDGKKSICVSILNDGKNKEKKYNPTKDLSPKGIRKAVFNAGIVGLGGAKYPTHLKLNSKKNVHTILVNGAECEDYLTCDDVLMQNYAKQILQGACLCAKFYGIKKVCVAIANNKKLAIEKMQENALKIKNFNVEIKVVESYYPVGFEKYLVEKALGLKLSQTSYPLEFGICVFNVATCFAIFEAVKKGKPLTHRVVTVSGRAINEPKNFWIPNGTPISTVLLASGDVKFDKQKTVEFENHCSSVFSKLEDEKDVIKEKIGELKKLTDKNKIKILKQTIRKLKKEYSVERNSKFKNLKRESKKIREGFKDVLAQIIAGGVMTGENIENAEVCVGKATGGVLFLTAREVDFLKPSPCINCGKCVSICPAKIFPNKLEEFSIQEDFENCKKFNIGACINCSCCSFVCPVKREISYNIKLGKNKLKGGR